MSQQRRDALDQRLRDAPLDLGGIPVINVEAVGTDQASVIFYLHGGRTRSERQPHPSVSHRTSHVAPEPGW